jgi:hypothetical protein
MSEDLDERIQSQDEWTFRECVGLASEFGLKARTVVVMVLGAGKRYVDGEGLPSEADGPKDRLSD